MSKERLHSTIFDPVRRGYRRRKLYVMMTVSPVSWDIMRTEPHLRSAACRNRFTPHADIVARNGSMILPGQHRPSRFKAYELSVPQFWQCAVAVKSWSRGGGGAIGQTRVLSAVCPCDAVALVEAMSGCDEDA